MGDNHRAINGEVIYVQNGATMRDVCCDCGLTHYAIYRISGKRIAITVFRDDYYTRQVRRARRKKK